ncbi:MAG: hypothetical protein K5984_02675 [Bacteroidales bacterium]|nr:hypothetical protein [Bacteroidales bacterium]
MTDRMLKNNQVAWALVDFLNNSPCAITKEVMKEADPEGNLPEEVLYAAIVAGLCDFDEEDDEIFEKYVRRSIKKLSIQDYSDNPYLKDIRFPDGAVSGGWKFIHDFYKPYEAFIRDDIEIDEDGREIPLIGYFDELFGFPCVQQDGREWMAVKPSEIESMKDPINSVSGKVITFGLGLGYFTYMASIKPDVESITVIERDQDAITLFTRYILPQFGNKDKVRIIKEDAFGYIDKMSEENYGYAFVDLWHDTSDGLPIYEKMKEMESKAPGTKFLYWVENSLISALNWKLNA